MGDDDVEPTEPAPHEAPSATARPSRLWLALAGIVVLAVIAGVAIYLATRPTSPTTATTASTSCSRSTMTQVVHDEFPALTSTVTTSYCSGTRWAIAAYNSATAGMTGTEWGVSVFSGASGTWKRVAGGNDGTCVAAAPGTRCLGIPAPTLPIPHAALLSLVANSQLITDPSGDIFPRTGGMLTQSMPCSQQATFSYIAATSVTTNGTGPTTVTGHDATVSCGGPDDMHYVTGTAPLAVTLSANSVITILDQSQDYAPVIATSAELQAYVARDPDGNVFRFTGAPTAATGLFAMFHP